MEKIVDMTDALKQVRATGQEKLVVTKTDKKINSPAYQNYKAGDDRYTPAKDLEEQKRQLEEEIKCLSEEMDSMIQEKRQEGFAVRYSLDGQRKVQAYKTEKDAEHRAKILKSMGGVKDVSITKHTLNFKGENYTPTQIKEVSIPKSAIDYIRSRLSHMGVDDVEKTPKEILQLYKELPNSIKQK